MALILCIETAAPQTSLVLGRGDAVLFSDQPSGRVESPVYLRKAVEASLEQSGHGTADIDAVAVDVGPGGLMATRSGVTFANVLAYALGKPLIALNSFDLVGREAWQAHGLPVFCVRPTTEGDALAAVFDQDGLGPVTFGALERQVDDIAGRFEKLTVAGPATEQVVAMIGTRCAAIAGPVSATPEMILTRASALLEAGAVAAEPLDPLTTQSPSVTALPT